MTILGGVDRNTIVKVVAVWFVIAAVLSACGGVALLGVGGLAGGIGAGAATVGSGQDAVDLAVVGGQSMLLGVVTLIQVPLFLIVAFGLFQGKAWARQGTILIAAIGLVVSVLTFSGSSIVSIIIDAVIIYMFATDPGIKSVLSN